MADFLKNFIPGEDIKASDTNDNNQFLLDKISDNAQNLQEYLNQRLGVMESNIATIQTTLQNNIDNLSTAINEIKENEPTVLKGQNGYIKFANGIIVQWGLAMAAGNSTGTTVTLPTAFSTTSYAVTANPISNTSEQNCIMGKTTTTFRINSHGHGGSAFYNDHNVTWIAVGY